MKIWNDLNDVPSDPCRTVITLGCFDGVHRGHQILLARLAKVAAREGAESVVVTFDRLPAQLLYPETAPVAIMALDDRLSALEAAGVDSVLVIKYTRDFASQPADSFVEQVFVKSLHAAAVVVGEDCRFGQGRAGSVETLKDAGSRWNFSVSVMSDRTADGHGGRRYSSTWAREALSSGDIDIAEQILGRPHRIRMKATWSAGSWTTKIGSVRGMLPISGNYAGWTQIGSGERGPATICIPGKDPLATDTVVELQMPGSRSHGKLSEEPQQIIFDFSSRL